MAIPGPIAACAKSTGAILAACIVFIALGNSLRSSRKKSRRVVEIADSARGRHERTMDEARALAPSPMLLVARSVRIGHVAVIANPDLINPSNMVSQPVDATPVEAVSLLFVSACLKA